MRMTTFVGGLLALGVTQAGAADWAFDPKVAVSAVYNDNIELTEIPGEAVSVSGAKVDAEVTLRADAPRTSFRLTPRLRSTFYPGDPEEEADDQFIRMALDQKTERTEASLNADYSRMITLGAYFPTSTIGPSGELGNPGTGADIARVNVRNREERLDVIPAFSFEVSPRGSIDLHAEYLDVGYDKQVPGDQTDYSNIMGLAAYRFEMSRTASLALRGMFSKYDPKNGYSSTDTYGLDAEWSNRLSDTQQIYLRGGAEQVQVAASAGGTKWDTGFSGGAGIRWAFQVTNIFVDLNRRLDPSSSGKVVTRDQLRLQLSRKLGPTTTAFVGARGIKDSGTGGSNSYPGEEYATGSVGFEWRMTRQFALAGSYDYYWRKYEGAPRNADANAVSLGVVYEPHRL